MSDNTHIEWTDATWNPITGCSVVSAGCKHCYAMKLAGTRLQHHPSRAGLTIDTKAGPVWTGEVRLNEDWLDQPLRWRRPRRIFVCAHGDLFHESVPDEWIAGVFAIMHTASQHTFQVLTKRPARMLEWFKACGNGGGLGWITHNNTEPARAYEGSGIVVGTPNRWPLPNVWLGVSVEDQAAADERIPLLLQCPAAVRWISAEPLLGPIDLDSAASDGLHAFGCGDAACDCGATGIGWVVAGGESGTGARPMHPDWARSLRDQCAAAGVPFLFKQWGAWAPPGIARVGFDGIKRLDLRDMHLVGKKAAGRLLDGVQHDGYPEAA